MKVERSIEIAAPPEAVYEVVMDPARLGDWVTVHNELVHAPNGVLEEGDELAQKLKVAGHVVQGHLEGGESASPPGR